MNKKNSTLLLAAVGMITIIFISLKKFSASKPKTRFTIGILQTASHPALDAARDGFIEELQKLLGDDVSFSVRNGQGSIANIHTIAQQFHHDKNIQSIFAIATPAVQAISTIEKNKPIFIAAVTDPQTLGLIHPITNVCGTNDMIDVSGEITFLTKLLPKAQTVGLLYNNGELNSITLANLMRQTLKEHHLTPIDFAITSESDLPTAAQVAFAKTDVILAPTDNMVASSITLLASLADKNKKPLIVSDNMLIKNGALASKGVDYKESGKQTAQIAYEVLVHNTKPYNLPIQQAKSDKVLVNKKVANLLNVTISESLKQDIVFV